MLLAAASSPAIAQALPKLPPAIAKVGALHVGVRCDQPPYGFQDKDGHFAGVEVEIANQLAANAFGKADAGMMFGWIMIAHQLGSATAAFGAGLIRTRFDDYTGAFLVAGLLCLAAALVVLRIGVTPSGVERRPAADVAPA